MEEGAVQLQVALDRLPLEAAVSITRDVADATDWVEVGTSMIKRYGVTAIDQVVSAAGETPVLADLKTIDDAEFELGLAYDAGARSATVVGQAPPATIGAAVGIAADHDRELMVDLIGMTDESITALASRVPAGIVLEAHVGKDSQAAGTDASTILGAWAHGRRVAIAGGLTAGKLVALRGVANLRAIVGSAVTKSANPAHAVRELRRVAEGGSDSVD
jgi:3-hexulose-6-phosphate synthase